MKKISFLLALVVAIHFNTKAQDHFLAYAGYKAIFTGNLNSPNKATIAAQLYMAGDSARIVKDHAYYRQKSKEQRNNGLILLGSGVVVSGVGLLIATKKDATFDQQTTGGVIMLAGAVLGIVSIPMMIMATVNHHKASTMISSQPTGFGVPANVSKNITGITMSIPIGK